MSNESSENCCIIDAQCGIDSASPHTTQFTDGFNRIKFLTGKNFDEYTMMIITDIGGYVHVIPTDGEILTKECDENGNTVLLWNIGKEITASDGAVIYQIAAYKYTDDKTDSVWYSKEGRLFVSESIDSATFSANVVGSEPSILTKLLMTLDCVSSITTKNEGKLAGIEDGAEVNVQADWNEEDDTSDAFIKNKPKIDAMLDPSSDNAIANHAVASEISALGDALIISRSQIEANASKINLVDQKASDTKSELESHKRDFESLNSVVEAESEELANHRQNAFPDEKHLTDSEKADVGKIGKIEADLGDIASIQSLKSNIVEAYNELWDTVDRHGVKIYAAQSGVDNIMNGEVNVPVADFANQALTDTNGNYITDFYATKEELRPHPVYVMPSTLAPNVTYNFTTQPNITLAFPTVANDGDVIYITFECAETSTNLTVDTTNTSDIDLIPEANTGYEIYAKYNGSIWIVKYSEYTVSEVA